MNTPVQQIKNLIDLVAEENIEELEISEPHRSIRLVRRAAGGGAACVEAPASSQPAVSAAGPAASRGCGKQDALPVSHTVSAPMAGTFYRSASVGGEPLVDPGSAVTVGTSLCVIEAMKIMNDIGSEKAGTVVQVLCESGQSVEQGQALFVIQLNEGRACSEKS